MSSTNKYPSGLNKWIESDKPEMEDFNSDNRLLDEDVLWKAAYDNDNAVLSAGGIPGYVGRKASVAGIAILGTYDTYEELLTDHPVGSVGDAYLMDRDLYVWDAADTAWQNAGTVQGEPGLTVSVNGVEQVDGDIGLGAGDIPVEDKGQHFTASDVEGALSELFTSVSNGKAALVADIEEMGCEVDRERDPPTFIELGLGVLSIPTMENLIHMTADPGTYTAGGLTIVFHGDGTITASGTSTSSGSVSWMSDVDISLAAGTYVFITGTPMNWSYYPQMLNQDHTYSVNGAAQVVISENEDIHITRLRIVVNAGYTVPEGMIFTPIFFRVD